MDINVKGCLNDYMTNNCEHLLNENGYYKNEIKSEYLKEFCKEKMKCINNKYFSFLSALFHCFQYTDLLLLLLGIIVITYLKYY